MSKLTRIGIDFGTSNSAIAATTSDGAVHLASFPQPSVLELYDGSSRTASTAPTLMFFGRWDRKNHMGREAVLHYLGSGLEGRFIQSIKAYLPSKTFNGTHIRGKMTSIEALIALFLKWLVARAEESFGAPLDGPVVVGRPARFTDDAAAEALAQERLSSAVAQAGLQEVTFRIEPVAAALSYEAGLEGDQVVLVADLGGGTSDFTVMEVGPSHRDRGDRLDSVLASGGVAVAGDRIDGEIVRAVLLPLLGQGSSYSVMGAPTRVPGSVFQKLLRWNHVSFLKSRDTLEFLRLVEQTSDRPEAIGALLELVDSDLGYVLYRAVERAKIAMATSPTAMIEDTEIGLPISTELTVETFRRAIAKPLDEIMLKAEAVLASAGTSREDIDAVFLTGGTSLLGPVRERFAALFGEHKLAAQDSFTSVAKGLVRG